jgi:hypothetical protein
MILFSSFVHAKTVTIKPKIIKLSKKKIKNKNIYFSWDSKEKKVNIKRNKKHIQSISFGVQPSGIEIIDVNFDGYGDVLIHINENRLGEYLKKGEFKHYFYYLYDKKKKKFIYQKKLSELIYSVLNFNEEAMKGFSFDAKNKRLIIGDNNRYFYGTKAYSFKDKKLVLEEREFRIFPDNYPDGVDIDYKYKNEELQTIKAYKDGKPNNRKSVSIVVQKNKESKLESTLKKALLNDLNNLFINHQIDGFFKKYFRFYDDETVEDENALMYVVIMLDTMFKKEGKREKNDTIFELIEKFSKIEKLTIHDFYYDKEQGLYRVDAKLHFKRGVEEYSWYFYHAPYWNYPKGAYFFAPISYDAKNKVNIILNEGIYFEYKLEEKLKIWYKRNSLILSSLVVYDGKKGWTSSESDSCKDKYMEFRVFDYTGDGKKDWFHSCTSSLFGKDVGMYHLRYGYQDYHSFMIPKSGNRYTWHEKKKRFVFAKTIHNAYYSICNTYKNTGDVPYFKCDKTYWLQTENHYSHLIGNGTTYIDKKLFEASIDHDELYEEDARDKVKKGATLYWVLDDIAIKKERYNLDENEYVLVLDKDPIPIWDKNISTTKPSQQMISVLYRQRTYWMDIEQLKAKVKKGQ